MILYRVEYKKYGNKWWSEMSEFIELDNAVKYAESQGKLDWFQDYDFRIIKRTVTEEEVAL